MKVILLKHLPNIGRAGELKEVSDGFARNFLLKKKVAEIATPEKIARLKQQEERRVRDEQKKRDEAEKIFVRLKGEELSIVADRVSKSGKLFAALHPKDISRALEKEFGIRVPESSIEIPSAVKSLGDFPCTISLSGRSVKLLLHIVQKH